MRERRKGKERSNEVGGDAENEVLSEMAKVWGGERERERETKERKI